MNVSAQPAAPDFIAARFNMVESQIRPNKVRNERLLSALGDMPREIFVPSPLSGIAYIDEDIQLTANRFLLEPMVLARLLETADIKDHESVLDVAPATGYSTGIIAALAKKVTGLEAETALAQKAAANLAALGIKNASVETGPHGEGWKSGAPYDVILVNGGVEFVPEKLAAQLADGGRLLLVMRAFGPVRVAHTGEARLYENIRGKLSHRPLFDANVKILPGFEARQAFTF
ncbi:MAG: protein-L-isoaspartate O-methyltransferase [Bdellovibrionales bacterium]